MYYDIFIERMHSCELTVFFQFCNDIGAQPHVFLCILINVVSLGIGHATNFTY